MQTTSLPLLNGMQGPCSIEGTVTSVVFSNEETGYSVLHVHHDGSIVTLVGFASSVMAGEIVEADGAWVDDKRFGKQFKAEHIAVKPPTKDEAILAFLSSGMIKGIGKKLAKAMVECPEFKRRGLTVFEVIEHHPDLLLKVKGVGEGKAQSIRDGWEKHRAVRKIAIFLHEHGIGSSKAVRIHKQWGDNAIDVISQNPYLLAEKINGIGFVTADTLALKIGIEKTAPQRLKAGVVFAMQELTASSGHCGTRKTDLVKKSLSLLGIGRPLVEQAIDRLVSAGKFMLEILAGEEIVFSKRIYDAETNAALLLTTLAAGKTPWSITDVEEKINQVETDLKIKLAAAQRDAVRVGANSKVCVVTGGPGTGKTTVTKSILSIVGQGLRVLLCAPTGRAAKRLAETTGLPAKTIHRTLELDPKTMEFSRNEDNPLECDLVLVDEYSMTDVLLTESLLKAIPPHAGLIIVGDVDQLPSVGQGQVLADIINSGVISVVRLIEIFRQAATSAIITNAHKMNKGEMPEVDKASKDFFVWKSSDPVDATQKIVDLVTNRIPSKFGFNPLTEIQVLTPMNKNACGTRELNAALQAALNPNPSSFIEKFGTRYGVADKVMQTKNDYDNDVFNGDVGFVAEVDLEEKEIKITFDGRLVTYGFDDLDTIVLAYATTIHKSQGSEYKAVVMPVLMQHRVMLAKNLIYTGTTRGKELVVLVGNEEAVRTSVQNNRSGNRLTRLRDLLISWAKKPLLPELQPALAA